MRCIPSLPFEKILSPGVHGNPFHRHDFRRPSRAGGFAVFKRGRLGHKAPQRGVRGRAGLGNETSEHWDGSG